MLQVRGLCILRAYRALVKHRGKLIALGNSPNLFQSGIAADRSGILPHQFHAVVIFRIVTGCHDDAATDLQIRSSKVDFFGATATDINHIGTAIREPFGECSTELLAAEPDIVAHHNLLRYKEFYVGPAYPVSNICIKLIRNPATNVVCLEAGDFGGHSQQVIR